MEEVLLTIAVVLALALLILPIVSFVMVIGARRRITVLEGEKETLEAKLQWLYDKSKAPPAVAGPADDDATRPTPRAANPVTVEIADAVAAKTATANDDPDTEPAASVIEPETLSETEPPSRPEPQPEVSADAAAFEPAAPATPPVPKLAFEQRLAAWFTRIGAGALVLGALYFFKYAVDSEWIGPMGRVLAGALAGVATLVAAEVARTRTRSAFTQILVGIGLALLFISSWASSVLYGLVATQIAFAANVIILLVGALLAWRYRGEAILVLVALAGFANPVALSTGVDRPIALFSYLLLIGAIVLSVAALRKLPISIAVTILGTAAIFVGWHDEYFRIFDNRGDAYADLPPNELVGAYFPLAARIAPLVFVTLAAIEWLAVAVVARRRETMTWIVAPISLAALLLWHGGVTAILPDQSVLLGAAMIVVGASSVLVMRHLGLAKLLVVPMLLAFFLLAGGTGANRDQASPYVLALLGVWSGVYVVAFLYDALRAGRAIGAKEAIPSVVALDAFAMLALITTIPDDYRSAALATVVATVAGAYVAYRARMPGLILSSVIIGFLGLGVSNLAFLDASPNAFDPALLVLDALWAGGLLAATMLLATKDDRKITLVTAAAALLAGLALTLVGVEDVAPTLRALLTAGYGIASLALATAARGKRELHVTVFSAVALALFAAAAGFGLSGATITACWAALFVVTAIIYARTNEHAWLVAAGLLLVAVLFRITAFDVPAAQEIVQAFMRTRGGDGAPSVPVLLNARAYGLIAGGVSALAASFLIRDKAGPRAITAAVFAVVGYGLLTILAITEVRAAILELPPLPPVALDIEEFSALLEQITAARHAQAGMLDVATTVVLAIVAAGLLSFGFIMKDSFHRYLGLVLFVATIGKLAAYDVWELPRLYQVVVLTVVGALLVASGFLYARLKGLFANATAAVVFVLLLPGTAQAEPESSQRVEVHRFASDATLTGVDGGGYYVFTIPPGLYEHANESLTDVRIAKAGSEVAFVVQDVPADRPAKWVHARMFDPGEIGNGAFRATFELSEEIEHCELELKLRGDGAFLRRTRVETGAAPDDFQTVAEGAIVYALESGDSRYEGRTLRYPSSLARYVRVTLMPDPDATTTEIRGARFACVTPDAVDPRIDAKLAVLRTERDESARRTHVFLDAKKRGLPLDHITLDIQTKEYVRRVEVGASDYERVWPSVGSGVVHRVGRADGAGSHTMIRIRPTMKRYFRITIEDGDDAPLQVTGASGSYRAQRIVFAAKEAGEHRLLTKNPDAYGPSYDLHRILAKKDALAFELEPATLSALRPNPDYGAPPAERLPWTEQHRGTIGAVLIVVLLGLAAWAVRLFVKR